MPSFAALSPIAFNLGPLPVRWYGLIIITGIFVAIWLAGRLAARRGLDAEFIYDLALWVVPAGIIGARLYEVFILQWPYYREHPGEIFAIWEGGLAIHGGVILGALVGIIYGFRRKQPVLAWADAVAPGLLLAQAIGRWGNFFNQEAYGNAVPAEGLAAYPAWFREQMFIDGAYRLPTFFYESLSNLAGVLILLWLYRRRPNAGTVGFAYLVVYNIGRYFIEGVRLDSSFTSGGWRVAQVAALVMIAIGLAGFVWRKGWRAGQAPDVALAQAATAEGASAEAATAEGAAIDATTAEAGGAASAESGGTAGPGADG